MDPGPGSGPREGYPKAGSPATHPRPTAPTGLTTPGRGKGFLAPTTLPGPVDRTSSSPERWITRDGVLIASSAFFADLGYQGVTVLFPVLLVLELKLPAYDYGLLLALSFGVGSLFSLVGGWLADRRGRKWVALVGNALIPLMSISVLFPDLYVVGGLFVLGWWARYFRTPARRAWLADLTPPPVRSRVFGFLHALDVGGGLLAVTYSVVLFLLGVPLREIVLLTLIPLVVSTLVLLPVRPGPHDKNPSIPAPAPTSRPAGGPDHPASPVPMFQGLLVAATLFGFSYYAFGFPVLTVSESTGSIPLGMLTFGIYLGVSALAGYFLGRTRGKRPLRTLWSLGYLLAAVSSLGFALAYLTHSDLALFYLAAAGLGFATGSVETFEPVLVATWVKASSLSKGMGWLSSSRALGLLVSNVIVGILFTVGQTDAYAFAFATALAAGTLLWSLQRRSREP
jgi:MFS family permease